MQTIKTEEIGTKEVRILLSTPISTDRFAGWQDGVRVYEMKQRIGLLADKTSDLDE